MNKSEQVSSDDRQILLMGRGAQMNKFGQVSSGDHQMSLAGCTLPDLSWREGVSHLLSVNRQTPVETLDYLPAKVVITALFTKLPVSWFLAVP